MLWRDISNSRLGRRNRSHNPVPYWCLGLASFEEWLIQLLRDSLVDLGRSYLSDAHFEVDIVEYNEQLEHFTASAINSRRAELIADVKWDFR